MVELSPLSPSEEASPNNDTQLIDLPNLSGTSSPPRLASPPSDHENAVALLSRDRSSSPPTAVTPPRSASAEMGVRPATEQPQKPSRQSSPETLGRGWSPSPTVVIGGSDAARTPTIATRRVQDDLSSPRPTPSPSSSPSPPRPPRSPKGKGRADDHPPSANSDLTLEPQSDNEGISGDASDEESANPSLPLVPDEKQLEIDHVIAAIPMKGPQMEPDNNIEVDDGPEMDEGFYEETMESRYHAFLAATQDLRARRRPYHRIRVPGCSKETMPALMGLTQKPIRVRKRQASKSCSPIAGPSCTWSSSASTTSSPSPAPASPSPSPPTP